MTSKIRQTLLRWLLWVGSLNKEGEPQTNIIATLFIYRNRSTLVWAATQYNLCLTIFFIPYALFEVPSNMVLKFLKPSVWVPIMMVVWGTIAT